MVQKLPLLVLVDVVLAIEPIHAPRVKEYDADEGEDRSLLGEPESEVYAEKRDLVERPGEQNPEAERHDEPDEETCCDETQVRPPIALLGFTLAHLISPSLRVLSLGAGSG